MMAGSSGSGRSASSSSSLPRSPEADSQHHLTAAAMVGSSPGIHLGGGGSAGGSGHGSLGSHSSHEVSYMNIYQNTANHPHLYDTNLDGSPRHSLGSNNSSNLSTPPSPARDVGGSSSYES